MNYSGKIFTAAVALVLCCSNIFAQEQNPQDTTAAPKPAISENAPMFRSEGGTRVYYLDPIPISETTRQAERSYAVLFVK